MGKVKAIPEGFHTLTPYLIVREAARAIEFYQRAFGAKSRSLHHGPDGKSIVHAELQIGDSIFMLGEEYPAMKILSPQSLGGSGTGVHIYVEDVDALFNQAVSAGATVAMPLMDAFWGDRYGKLVDPFGHHWSLATHKQDLSEEEIEKAGKIAMAEMMAKQAKQGS